MANSNQTALYSLNRIGDHGPLETLGSLGNGLVLQGSTVILDSAAIETANLKSVDHEEREVTLAGLSTVPNTVLLVPESCSGSPTQIRIRKKQIMGQYRVMRI